MVTEVIEPSNAPAGLVSNVPLAEVEAKLMVVSAVTLTGVLKASWVCMQMIADALPAVMV